MDDRSQITYRCDNPFCNTPYSLEEAQEQADKEGVIFACCGQKIFQAVECRIPGCNGKVLFQCDADKPLIDMSRLILIPHQFSIANAHEQIWIIRNQNSWHDYLKFKFLPAWDKSVVSEEEFMGFENEDPSSAPFDATLEIEIGQTDCGTPDLDIRQFFKHVGIPLFVSEQEFYDRLNQEKNTGQIKLRRLLPDTPQVRKVLTALAPNKVSAVLMPGVMIADGTAPEDLTERRKTFKALIKNATGHSLEEAIIERLTSKNIDIPLADIKRRINEELFYQKSFLRNQLWDVMATKGGMSRIDDVFKRVFHVLFNPICTRVALEPHRKELLNWPKQVRKRKALFIDAPMGLGKTYSIVEALVSNPNLSAAIFMPTKKMCEEIIELLKGRIAASQNKDIWNNIEPVFDKNGNRALDEEGLYKDKFKADFLTEQVYYAEGINPEECPHYNEFMARYKYGMFMKKRICRDCDRYKRYGDPSISCRFRRHWLDAPESRIIVATHQQYRNFLAQGSALKWYKDGIYKKDDFGNLEKTENGEKIKNVGTARDVFIVDEDIIFSQLYKPVKMDKKSLRAFIATITDFLATPDNFKDAPLSANMSGKIGDINSKIDRVLAQFEKCDTTTVVPPIDIDFQVPRKIKDAWGKSFREEDIPIPDTLDGSEPIGNHLDIIEKAIQSGFVVQAYDATFTENGERKKQKLKYAYFPNPATINLANRPSHVFFDGTMLDEKFLSNKIKGVGVKKVKINITPVWNITVRQNMWTDLPKSKIEKDQANVERMIEDLINELGEGRKYFIATKKDIEEAYLAQFLQTKFPDLRYVINHYGNLRGDNSALDCDVGILVGSHSIPDAVEIAMAMDFIKDRLKPNKLIATKGKENLWTYSDVNFRRIYRDDFSIVGEIAHTYRTNEHRQALARTRYLSHDVDFYVLSKDLVNDYEPFLPKVETVDYRADLFSKMERPDKKYEEVKAAVFDWLNNKRHSTVKATDIHQNYNIRRQTVGKYLKEMLEEGWLEKVGKTKYRLSF